MKRLTWYPGSVLPYASLWHTVNRVVWLNAMTFQELVGLCGTERRRRVRSSELCETMFSPSIDPHRLASLLGERREAFRFCAFDQFPSWAIERYAIPRIRWCPECIAHGYHSNLSSLRLLAKCPIHGVPLLDQCPSCHEIIPSTISVARLRWSAICRCGLTHLVPPEACRLPTLAPGLTQAWKPVALWLQELGQVFQPSLRLTDPSLESLLIAITPRWCSDLDIRYPSCFEDESNLSPPEVGPVHWSTYKARSGALPGNTPRPLRSFILGQTRPMWADSPETLVYRAMARHLRRHGVRHSDRWMKQLAESLNPVGFAAKMRAQTGVRAAFAEMVWSRGLEPDVFLRRWPNRRGDEALRPKGLGGYDAGSPYRDITLLGGNGRQPDYGVETWLRSHGLGLAGLAMWNAAQLKVAEAIDTGWADWTSDPHYLHGKVFWFGRVQHNGVQFVGYLRNLQPPPFRSPMLTKSDRIFGLAMRPLAHLSMLRSICCGPCLTWTACDGWHVLNDLKPDTNDVRQMRLLHVGRAQKFWLFQAGGHFVARMTAERLQVVADAPNEAINGLRLALLQHRRLYPEQGARAEQPSADQNSTLKYFGTRASTSLRPLMQYAGEHGFWRLPSGAMKIVRQGVLKQQGFAGDGQIDDSA